MPRKRREISVNGLYHVIARGNSQQIIFEHDSDYKHFRDMMFDKADETGMLIIAYCLMDNHVHLLVQDREENLSLFMERVLGSYAVYFNYKYDRTGHLFQGRFRSKCITDQDYFYEVYRYILNNPVKAGICRADMYRWSSYGDYYDKDPRTCIDKIKERFPEEKLFEEFISNKTDKGVQYFENAQLHLNDEELQRMIKELTGADSGFEIASFPRKERNNAVRLLRSAGMTIKTVVRLTGIGYGIVAKCRPNK